MCYCALKSGTEKYLKSSLGQREKYVLVKLYNLICSNQLLLQFINFNKFSTATNIWFSSPCLFRNDDIAYEETLQIRACNLVGNSNFSVSWYTISKHKAQDIEEHSKVCFQTDSMTRHLTRFSTLFWSLSSDSEACPEFLRHESEDKRMCMSFKWASLSLVNRRREFLRGERAHEQFWVHFWESYAWLNTWF